MGLVRLRDMVNDLRSPLQRISSVDPSLFPGGNKCLRSFEIEGTQVMQIPTHGSTVLAQSGFVSLWISLSTTLTYLNMTKGIAAYVLSSVICTR